MKSKTLLLAITALAMGSCANAAFGEKTITASGADITGNVQAQKIHEIDAAQGIVVNYTVGNPVSVSYIVPESLSQYLDIVCREGTLKCRYKNGINVKLDGRKVIVNVVAPNVSEFDAGSAAVINTTGILSNSELEVDAQSAATIAIEAANVNSADIEASSSGSVVVNQLSAKRVDIDASSSSTIAVSGAMGMTEVEASSSAVVKLAGSCEMLKAEASSSASIDATAAQIATGNLEASAGATIEAPNPTVSAYKITKNSGGSVNIR